MSIRNQDQQIVNEISEYIKKIQANSGEEQKSLILKARKKFQLEKNEKWVITKLRMLLISYKADLKFFEINPPEKITTKDAESKQCVVNERQSSVPKKKINSSNKEKHISEAVRGRKLKPRLTAMEKQLNKLRNATFKESGKEKMKTSKLEYLKNIGLYAKVICLS